MSIHLKFRGRTERLPKSLCSVACVDVGRELGEESGKEEEKEKVGRPK